MLSITERVEVSNEIKRFISARSLHTADMLESVHKHAKILFYSFTLWMGT